MARAVDLDPPVAFKFSLMDVEFGYLGLCSVKVVPDGALGGPGQVTICGAFIDRLAEFMALQTPRNLEISLFGRPHPTDSRPPKIVHLYNARPWAGKAGPIEWDAFKSEVLMLRATMPYEKLVMTGGSVLERIAAQAGTP